MGPGHLYTCQLIWDFPGLSIIQVKNAIFIGEEEFRECYYEIHNSLLSSEFFFFFQFPAHHLLLTDAFYFLRARKMFEHYNFCYCFKRCAWNGHTHSSGLLSKDNLSSRATYSWNSMRCLLALVLSMHSTVRAITAYQKYVLLAFKKSSCSTVDGLVWIGLPVCTRAQVLNNAPVHGTPDLQPLKQFKPTCQHWISDLMEPITWVCKTPTAYL